MTTAIIQARLGSTRLPGKTLLPIGERSLLGHLLDRLRRVTSITQVVIATTEQDWDSEIVRFAEKEQIGCYRGSENDVLDRIYQAARCFGASVVVRVTPDCPFLDPLVTEQVISRFMQGDVDYVSNIRPPTFPDGLDTEVFSFRALERSWHEASFPSEREHVTPYIWKHPQLFRLANVANKVDLSSYRWTVDEARDLEFAREVYHVLGRDVFGIDDVLDVLKTHPELSQINRGIDRNEGYERSLTIDNRAS